MIGRRAFITLLGGAAAAWPLAASAQQPAKVPRIGFLAFGSAAAYAGRVEALRAGLRQFGYVEGKNIVIEFQFAETADQLPELAAGLVERKVTIIFAGGSPAVRAVRAQTAIIPIVFFVGEDPVKEGLVASLNRPGGNVTGVTNFQNQLFGKQLGILRDIAPRATAFAFLVNPNNPNAEPDTKDAQAAADAQRLELRVLRTKNEDDLEPAFAAIDEQRVGGLIVGVDGLFFDRREQLFALAARHAVPAIYSARPYSAAGGLMSYGASPVEAWRQVGVYVARILKGERPADLPVVQSAKFEFVINLNTAKALGLSIPPGVLAIADEVIE
jgi:putative ABC transport system substrate-binding protein